MLYLILQFLFGSSHILQLLLTFEAHSILWLNSILWKALNLHHLFNLQCCEALLGKLTEKFEVFSFWSFNWCWMMNKFPGFLFFVVYLIISFEDVSEIGFFIFISWFIFLHKAISEFFENWHFLVIVVFWLFFKLNYKFWI